MKAYQHILGCLKRILFRTFQWLRGTEESHYPIADKFVHGSAMLVYGQRHFGKIFVQQQDNFLR